MKTVVIERPNEIALVVREVPEPGPGELMIQVMASGICGTDLHIYRGEYMGRYPVIPGMSSPGLWRPWAARLHASRSETEWLWNPILPAITV
jgi:hypothetical protein